MDQAFYNEYPIENEDNLRRMFTSQTLLLLAELLGKGSSFKYYEIKPLNFINLRMITILLASFKLKAITLLF